MKSAPYTTFVSNSGRPDGKRILFENNDSLFHKLRGTSLPVVVPPERVAALMTTDEIHGDVHQYFANLMSSLAPSWTRAADPIDANDSHRPFSSGPGKCNRESIKLLVNQALERRFMIRNTTNMPLE